MRRHCPRLAKGVDSYISQSVVPIPVSPFLAQSARGEDLQLEVALEEETRFVESD